MFYSVLLYDLIDVLQTFLGTCVTFGIMFIHIRSLISVYNLFLVQHMHISDGGIAHTSIRWWVVEYIILQNWQIHRTFHIPVRVCSYKIWMIWKENSLFNAQWWVDNFKFKRWVLKCLMRMLLYSRYLLILIHFNCVHAVRYDETIT